MGQERTGFPRILLFTIEDDQRGILVTDVVH